MSEAQQLFDDIYKGDGAQLARSEAYKQGMLDALKYRTKEGPSPQKNKPYSPGTAEYDAWESGLQAGFHRWTFLRGQVG